MGLKEELDQLRSYGADQATIYLYESIYNGEIEEIPESWLEKEFSETMDLKYNGISTALDGLKYNKEVFKKLNNIAD
jgi:hypothetical protein